MEATFPPRPCAAPTQIHAATRSELDHQALRNDMLSGRTGAEDAQATLDQTSASEDARFVGALIDTLRYKSRLRAPIGDALKALTDQGLAPD